MGSAGVAQQGPSIDDLRTIEKLIESGDWRELYVYVDANPRLTTGSNPLATELRGFVEDVELGRLGQFDAPTGSVSTEQALAPTGGNDRIY